MGHPQTSTHFTHSSRNQTLDYRLFIIELLFRQSRRTNNLMDLRCILKKAYFCFYIGRFCWRFPPLPTQAAEDLIIYAVPCKWLGNWSGVQRQSEQRCASRRRSIHCGYNYRPMGCFIPGNNTPPYQQLFRHPLPGFTAAAGREHQLPSDGRRQPYPYFAQPTPGRIHHPLGIWAAPQKLTAWSGRMIWNQSLVFCGRYIPGR